MRKQVVLLAFLAASAIGEAQADTVHVHVAGTTGFNYNTGALKNMPSGSVATMDFNLDSSSFLDSSLYPTRGYAIDLSSFSLNIGGVALTLDNPQSTSYFVLRNNDPRVDGFFLSHGTDVQSSLSMHIPGMNQTLEFNFLQTFGGNGGGTDTTLKSVNLLDALGKYGTSQVTDSEWTIGYMDQVGTEIFPSTITISAAAVPEPASMALMALGLGAVAIGARRRKNTAI